MKALMYNMKSKIIHVKFKNNLWLNGELLGSLGRNLHNEVRESLGKVRRSIVGQSWIIKLDFCDIINPFPWNYGNFFPHEKL